MHSSTMHTRNAHSYEVQHTLHPCNELGRCFYKRWKIRRKKRCMLLLLK